MKSLVFMLIKMYVFRGEVPSSSHYQVAVDLPRQDMEISDVTVESVPTATLLQIIAGLQTSLNKEQETGRSQQDTIKSQQETINQMQQLLASNVESKRQNS